MLSFLSLDKGRPFFPKLSLKDEIHEIFFTADWSVKKACFEMQPSSEVLRIFRYMYILYSHYGQENDIFKRKFTNVYTGICKYSS